MEENNQQPDNTQQEQQTSTQPGEQPTQPPQVHQQPQTQQMPQKTNTLAIVSLVMALFAFLAPVSLITGIVSLVQIKKRGEKGRILAVIAILLSTVYIVLLSLFLALPFIQNDLRNSEQDESSTQQSQTINDDADQQDPVEEQEPVEDQEPADSIGDYSFTAPEDWEVTGPYEEAGIWQIVSLTSPDFVEGEPLEPAEEGTKMLVSVGDINPNAASVQDILDGEGAMMGGLPVSNVVHEVQPVTVDGNRGASYVWKWEGPHRYVTIFEYKGKRYSIDLLDYETATQAQINTYNQFVESFTSN